MNTYKNFREECALEIEAQGRDLELKQASLRWINLANARKYSYHFEWLGRPIIQYPQDMIAMQELLWSVKPDLVIETGIAHGGSLIFYASIVALNSLCGGPSDAEVLGIDIDIRPHNRSAIEAHPLSRYITMIEGSSIAPDTVAEVVKRASAKKRILVCLDSNHSHAHVAAELAAYAHLTSVDSYCVVFDTIIEDLPAESFADRPWGKGDNAMTAVREFLSTTDEFEADTHIDDKLLLSVAPRGYLRKIK